MAKRKRNRRNLKDMVVLITGASAGIGKELAQQLSAKGAKLALCARRIEKLEELNRSLGGQHFIFKADVSKQEDCEAFVRATLEHFGRIDTLVCNAGFGQYKRTIDFTPDEIRQMFATNVFGTTDIIHAAVPAMTKQDPRDGIRGQIMIVSSAAARRGVPYLGPYAATKAAQLSISEALRVELRSNRIKVTSVHPIVTKTEFGDAAENVGDIKMPRAGTKIQTVKHVCRTMVQAITWPRREVWPSRPARWVLALGALMPGIGDHVMGKFLQMIEKENPQTVAK